MARGLLSLNLLLWNPPTPPKYLPDLLQVQRSLEHPPGTGCLICFCAHIAPLLLTLLNLSPSDLKTDAITVNFALKKTVHEIVSLKHKEEELRPEASHRYVSDTQPLSPSNSQRASQKGLNSTDPTPGDLDPKFQTCLQYE